jgi:hypothetical protein
MFIGYNASSPVEEGPSLSFSLASTIKNMSVASILILYLPVESLFINFRNVLLVNSSADHLKVGDFGLSKLIKVQNSHDVYKMTGETGSCECL